MDIEKNADGKTFYEIYGTGGTPSLTIFNTAGEVLIDSDCGTGNIGFPATENELAHYVIAMKKSIPNIGDQESVFWVSKMKENRKRKLEGQLAK